MHVGVVVPGALEQPTGGYVYDRQLVEYLRGAGDDVTVVTIPGDGETWRVVDNLRPLLVRTLRSLDCDVVVQDTLCRPSLLLLNRFVASPTVGLVHLAASGHPDASRLERVIERRYLSGLSGLIYNSETTKRALDGTISPNHEVVATPGGDRFDRPPSDEAIRERAFEAPLRLLALGSVEPRKGYDTLVEALQQLDPSAYELRILGRVDAHPQFARRLSAQIRRSEVNATLTGAVPDDVVQDALGWAHVLVVPSRYEAFGIVYLEAMRFGVVPICTTAGAGPEVVGEDGIVVPPDDPSALADVLRELSDDRDRLSERAFQARQHFDRFPSWAETMDTVRSFLLDVIE